MLRKHRWTVLAVLLQFSLSPQAIAITFVRRDEECIDLRNPLLDAVLQTLAEGGLLRRIVATGSLRNVMLEIFVGHKAIRIFC